jgi:hypothetical protein
MMWKNYKELKVIIGQLTDMRIIQGRDQQNIALRSNSAHCIFVNKVLWEHRDTYLFIYCPCLCRSSESRVV